VTDAFENFPNPHAIEAAATEGPVALRMSAERATSRRAAGPKSADGFEELRNLHANEAAATEGPVALRMRAECATSGAQHFDRLENGPHPGSTLDVEETPKRARRGPPHNPGVRELVSGKRPWSPRVERTDAIRGFQGWHERGYLPHRDAPGLTQFVTFHLADSFPAAVRSEWAALLDLEDDGERRKKLEGYLDKSRGECHLRRPEIGNLVDAALRFNHGKTYELHAWVVMPNHVHALFNVGNKPLSQVVADWKEYTARQANKLLGRRGQFWAKDFWDTYMRDSAHEQRARRYIESNPVKAFLVRGPKEWPWSSARFRDETGVLRL